MSWLKFGETNPPADMEILIWNKKRGAFVGSVAYNNDLEISFIYIKDPQDPNDSSAFLKENKNKEYTHWCEIPQPMPPLE